VPYNQAAVATALEPRLSSPLLERLPAERRWAAPLVLSLFLVLAVTLLGVGIGKTTGITSKDEYFLTLRTPMCMVEQDVWLIPCLDGQPRIKKPPMLYWITRASYEAFGVSLESGRGVVVVFASLLALSVVLIGLELTRDLRYSLFAGLVSLSFLGLAVGARVLVLDIPVAAFSALAFYCLLRWYRRNERLSLLLAMLLLAAGFLAKGPIVLVLCGAGALSLLVLEVRARRLLLENWPWAALGLLVFAALALPWFWYVHQQLPGESRAELAEELAARDFFRLSAVPLTATLVWGLPWSFLSLRVAVGLRRLESAALYGESRLFLLWLLVSLLPFFFIKTFERYVYGSMVPLALLTATVVYLPVQDILRWPARVGMVLSALLFIAVAGAVGWFQGASLALTLGLVALAYFLVEWWPARRPLGMAVSAALLWLALLGLVYPRLGVNAIPERILAEVRGQPVLLFQGPQPALLSAVLGRSLHQTGWDWDLPAAMRGPCARFLMFVPAEDRDGAVAGLRERGYEARQLDQYDVLSSRVTWLRMWRRGMSWEQVARALVDGDLEALKSRVDLYEVRRKTCPGG
jgi:4-amino-4-deoxy-L-arabinose transferase-like glycosyltransferase